MHVATLELKTEVIYYLDITRILVKYLEYTNNFLFKFVVEILKQNNNNHIIKLK